MRHAVQAEVALVLRTQVRKAAFLWSGIGVLLLAFFAELAAVNTSDSQTCTGSCAYRAFVLPGALLVAGTALILVHWMRRPRS